MYKRHVHSDNNGSHKTFDKNACVTCALFISSSLPVDWMRSVVFILLKVKLTYLSMHNYLLIYVFKFNFLYIWWYACTSLYVEKIAHACTYAYMSLVRVSVCISECVDMCLHMFVFVCMRMFLFACYTNYNLLSACFQQC